MRYILIIVLVMLSTNVLSLESKEIFNGWIEGYKTYNVSGKPLFLSISEDMETAYIKFGNEVISISNNTCDALGIYTLCYPNKRFSNYNTKTDTEVYEFNIKISTSNADIRVVKSISKQELYPNERAMITVEFKNVGFLPAESLSYSETISGLGLLENTGCRISGNTVTMDTQINPEETKYCRFYVYSPIEVEAEARGEFSYFNGHEVVRGDTGELKISFAKPELDAEIVLSQNISAGENLTIKVNIMNMHETDQISTRSINLKIPTQFEIVSLRSERFVEWVRSAEGLRIEQSIPPKENRTFSLVVKPLVSGKHNVTYVGSYSLGLNKRNLHVSSETMIGISRLSIFDPSERTLISGENQMLELYLGNREELGYAFRDIEVISDCLGIDKKTSFENIGPKEFLALPSKEITAPNVSNETNISCTFIVSYASEFGERFTINSTVEYTLLPKQEEKQTISYNGTGKIEGDYDEEKQFRDRLPSKIRDNSMLILMISVPAILLIIGLILFIRHKIDYKRRLIMRDIKIEEPEEKKEELEVAEFTIEDAPVEEKPIKKKKVKPSRKQ